MQCVKKPSLQTGYHEGSQRCIKKEHNEGQMRDARRMISRFDPADHFGISD
jgi:hypothetical protein